MALHLPLTITMERRCALHAQQQWPLRSQEELPSPLLDGGRTHASQRWALGWLRAGSFAGFPIIRHVPKVTQVTVYRENQGQTWQRGKMAGFGGPGGLPVKPGPTSFIISNLGRQLTECPELSSGGWPHSCLLPGFQRDHSRLSL